MTSFLGEEFQILDLTKDLFRQHSQGGAFISPASQRIEIKLKVVFVMCPDYQLERVETRLGPQLAGSMMINCLPGYVFSVA